MGFRSDPSSPSSSTTSSSSSSKKNCFQTSKKKTSSGFGSKASSSDDKDSALSESESDSGINWSYPVPEKPDRPGRPQTRGGDLVVPFRKPVLKMAQRSRSEDRTLRKMASDSETKVVDSSNFFLQRRPRPESAVRIPSLPEGGVRAIVPSYQLPVAYRSNFLAKGHSTCDLYSGKVVGGEVPAIPPPDYSCGVSVAASGGTISALVHREITKAVKQISGWI